MTCTIARPTTIEDKAFVYVESCNSYSDKLYAMNIALNEIIPYTLIQNWADDYNQTLPEYKELMKSVNEFCDHVITMDDIELSNHILNTDNYSEMINQLNVVRYTNERVSNAIDYVGINCMDYIKTNVHYDTKNGRVQDAINTIHYILDNLHKLEEPDMWVQELLDYVNGMEWTRCEEAQEVIRRLEEYGA